VSFAAITLCVASQRVFIVVIYFVIDSVRKILDTPSYVMKGRRQLEASRICCPMVYPMLKIMLLLLWHQLRNVQWNNVDCPGALNFKLSTWPVCSHVLKHTSLI
jgi:hypothetical protein